MRSMMLALALLACNGDNGNKDTDAPATGETGTLTTTPAAAFTVLGDVTNLPAASLLSIWGSDSSNVYMVGPDPGDGLGPLVIHFDGTSWTRLETGSTGDLWWVWSDGLDTVMMSGELGRVITYTISSGTFSEAVVTDPTYKLFGIWGTSATDVWAVGADINLGLPGVAVHFDGSTWTEMFTAPPNPEDLLAKRQIWKVWGAATDDVWFVGTGSLLLHWDGTAMDASHDALLYKSVPIITVNGRGADDVYGIGGFGNGVAVHFDGTAWADETPPPASIPPAFNGVYASPAHGTVACGRFGSFWWHGDTHEWTADPRPAATTRDFHACWIDETGEPWAVGGDLTSNAEPIVITGNPAIPPIAL